MTSSLKMNKETKVISGSEAVMRCLIEENVELIYGYPGGAIMPIYDELYKFKDSIKHVLTRHEQGATHSAQGYARVTEKPGVVFATSGPGATNLVTGLADAMIDSTPMVCITGQVPAHLLGSDAFQETDIISISMPVTKWNYQVTSADEIPGVIAKAFYIASSGRPGPVLIDITKNAQFEEAYFAYQKCTSVRSYKPVPEVEFSKIEEAAALINEAEKPLIVFGQGVILGDAEEELKALIEKGGIPATWTILGLSALETSHPLNMGMVGMHGNYACNLLTNQCDVLIAIGMRFDDRVTGNLETYAKQAKVIHFEIDPAEINKNVHADVPVLGNSKETLTALLPLIHQKTHKNWESEFHALHKKEVDQVIQKDLHRTAGGLGMGETIEAINKATNNDAIIVSDVGQHQMFACRYAKFSQTRSNLTSGGLGAMGFALPAAIGAKMGRPDREVVAIIGDGGFQMTIQELGTIFQTQAAVKIVIMNNQFLGMVRQWQELFFDRRYSATEMVNPDFCAIAKGYGIESAQVSERESLEGAVQKMIEHKGSYLLEVMIEKEDSVFPMVSSGACISETRLS